MDVSHLVSPRGKSWQRVTRYQSLACKALTAMGLQRPERSDRLVQPRNRPTPAASHCGGSSRLLQCLALPHGIEVHRHGNNLAQDLLLLGCWQEDGSITRSVLSVNRLSALERAFGPSHRGPVIQSPCVADERTGFRGHSSIQSLRPISAKKGPDVTLLASQHSYPLRDSGVLRQVEESL